MTTCNWSHHDNDNMPGTFDTGCKQLFSFTEEGINENRFVFCPYCGGKIHAVPLSEPDDN